MSSLLSVNVGLPRDVAWQGRTVRTGIWKYPVSGPRMARRLNIDGDGQGDLAGHGGEQRAVLVYQADSVRYWRRHFGRDDIEYGNFGENLTVDGLPDDEVCIGDRYRIGEAEFEVTQPRVTCYRVGLRLGEPELPSLLVSHHRPGFYLRVLREGMIAAGDPIVKTASGPGGVTVADADALLYLPGKDRAKLRAAAAIPALSQGWRGSFESMLEDGAEASGAPVTADAAGPGWAGFRPLRVTSMVRESAAVTSIELASEDGSALPAARAGQYLTLRIPQAGGRAPIRSYSLSSAPGARRYRISVKREPHGAASRYLTARLRPGTVLDAAAPRGDFVLDDEDSPVLLISAGIGVTPVLAMLHQLAAARSTRPVWWIHGARGPGEHPLAAEAHALLAELPHAREHVFYSTVDPAYPAAAARTVTVGRITGARLARLRLPADASAYVCGPKAFMDDMRAALTGAGIGAGRIHTEIFGAREAINPGVTSRPGRPGRAPHQPPGPEGTGPLVTFARSGLSARFPGPGAGSGSSGAGSGAGSLLEFAESCDVPTRYACRSGVCHTCVTPLVSGSVAYSPDPLEPPPGGQALICCARPETDIVVDM